MNNTGGKRRKCDIVSGLGGHGNVAADAHHDAARDKAKVIIVIGSNYYRI